MLSDSHRALIALAVDGRLTAAEDAAFRALVADSRDALTLFHALQSQAARLNALPRQSLTPERAALILQALATAPAPVAPLVTVRTPVRSGRNWLPHVIAASTLLAVAAGSFWASQNQPSQRGAGSAQLAPVAPHGETPEANKSFAAAEGAEPRIELAPPREVTRREVAHVDAPRADEVAPLPRVRPAGEVVGSGTFQGAPNLSVLEVSVPTLVAVSNLDQPETRRQIVAEHQSSPALRLDLFSRDTPRAVQTLQAAAKAAGVSLAVDGLTAERLKKNQPLAWAVYTDSLTADDLAKWLAQVAHLNREAGKDTPFGSAHLTPASVADSRDVRELFGIEFPLAKRASPPAHPSTADQVTQTLTKPVKSAILLTYAPATARTPHLSSTEVRSFLTGRGDRASGATPALIVIRPVN